MRWICISCSISKVLYKKYIWSDVLWNVCYLLQGLCDDDVDYGLDLVVEGEELPVLDLSGDVDACLLGDELRIGLLVPEGVRLRFYLRQAERRRVVVVQEELKVSLDSGVPRRLYFVRRHYLLLLLEVQQLTLHTLQFHPFRFQPIYVLSIILLFYSSPNPNGLKLINILKCNLRYSFSWLLGSRNLIFWSSISFWYVICWSSAGVLYLGL